MRQQTLDAFLVRRGSAAASTGARVDVQPVCGIILPWSAENYSVGGAGKATRAAWDDIHAILVKDASKNTDDLRQLMRMLNVHKSPSWVSSNLHFGVLCYIIDNVLTPTEHHDFFSSTLPWMRRVVLRGPSLLPHILPVLEQGKNKRMVLTNEKVETLLTCAFFSLFPDRFSTKNPRRRQTTKLASFNFVDLFCFAPSDRFESQCAKVRCLLQYFLQHSHQTGDEMTCIELYRVACSSFPDIARSTKRMQAIHMHTEALIEGFHDVLQVDFANKVIGGGVLDAGCVQEEIRFVTWPELLLSRLFSEPLLENEVVFISGAGQYSITEGYAASFRFVRGNSPEFVSFIHGGVLKTQRVQLIPITVGDWGDGNPVYLRNSCVVAMDALNHYGAADQQYLPPLVIREAHKAFVAFKGAPDSSLTLTHSGPVSTGNWGCGAFRGDCELKLMIQWCAASVAGRPLIYSTFGEEELCIKFREVQQKLEEEMWTVGDVFLLLLYFGHTPLSTLPLAASKGKLLEYILNAPLKCEKLELKT